MSYILPVMILIGVAVNVAVSVRNAKTAGVKRFVLATQLACVLLAVILVVVPAVLMAVDRLSMKAYLAMFSLFFLILIPLEVWSSSVIRNKPLRENTPPPFRDGAHDRAKPPRIATATPSPVAALRPHASSALPLQQSHSYTPRQASRPHHGHRPGSRSAVTPSNSFRPTRRKCFKCCPVATDLTEN